MEEKLNSPLTVRKSEPEHQNKEELSVEEAGERFGISLRHREPSTDSCSSAKSKNEDTNPLEKSPSVDTKSPMSLDSDAPIVGSPLEPLPPPPSFPSSNEEDLPEDEKPFKNLTMKEMLELKLVAEIKERADQKVKNSKEPSPNELFLTAVNHDPVAQLVSELSETMNMEKDLVRKTSQGQIVSKENEGIPYKSQLKRVDPPIKRPKDDTNNISGVIDFKSRLRKVDSAPDKKTDKDDDEVEKTIIITEVESEGNKRESTASSDSSSNLKMDESDDKRKSTGSISSLKKLWESKEASENLSTIQLSPKLSLKNSTNNEQTAVESLEESPLIRSASGRNTTKIWPPNSDEKPVVPVKPVVKVVKPIISKPGPAIYATPIAPKPPILAKPTLDNNKVENSENINKTNEKTERDSILEISQALESSLNSIRLNPTVSTATWLQLSDKIGLLHGSCMGYADSVVPAHTKFHFRELLTRLEMQGRQLRSAGSRNISENTRQLNEVTNTVKDVVNAVKIF